MWAGAATFPYYSAYHSTSTKRKASSSRKDGPASAAALGSAGNGPTKASTGTAGTAGFPAAASTSVNMDITDLLEPAVEGPPSPERIRALNKQMQRASTFDYKPSTTSSGSSSLRSHTERPSWDQQALEHLTLSRRSSGRSTASSMHPKERPDSVQIFGKTIFGRKGKVKRESSIHSSSGSSLHSADLSLDIPPKEPSRSIFGRRKSSKEESNASDDTVSPKKFLISGPYNFQHVTHTRRDHLPKLQRTSRMELVNEFATVRTAPLPNTPFPAAGGQLRGFDADDSHFADFSSDAAQLIDTHSGYDVDRSVLLPRHLASAGPRRLVKTTRSQDNLRVAPPRPPRPARTGLEPLYIQPPPVPPPRLSSRASIRYDGFDPLGTTTLDRPSTSGGFRQPGPIGSIYKDLPEPPATAHPYAPRSAIESMIDPGFAHHAVTTPDDEAWPLTPPVAAVFDAPLPDVPEEEEHYTLARRSRASLMSTNSSLRGSHSVPLLRQTAQAQAEPQVEAPTARRPPSSGSDTLGRLDMLAAQRALRAAALRGGDSDSVDVAKDSWEDDIDYCYEHEAEADCHYEWSRPSLDAERGDDDDDDDECDCDAEQTTPNAPASALGKSPALLMTPSRYDVPALSPASQTSVNEAEATTPTVPALPVPSNFSLPRTEGRLRIQHQRSASHASSFKESHGFTLSPSLLIPADYQQQMMLADSEMAGYDDPDTIYVRDFRASYDGAAPMSPLDRISTSTTGSSHSGSSGERHVSANSASTQFTRYSNNSIENLQVSRWSPDPEDGRKGHNKLQKLIPKRPDELSVDGPAPPLPHRSRRRANTTSGSSTTADKAKSAPKSPKAKKDDKEDKYMPLPPTYAFACARVV